MRSIIKTPLAALAATTMLSFGMRVQISLCLQTWAAKMATQQAT